MEQVDAMLAQLMLLHQHMRCMVDPKFFGDEAEEEVSLPSCVCNVVMMLTRRVAVLSRSAGGGSRRP